MASGVFTAVRRDAAGGVLAGAAFAAGMLWATAALPAAGSAAGVWTLSLDQSTRTCQLRLRTDPAGAGWSMAMPSGCRRALPILKSVQSWSAPGEHEVSLDDQSGASVLLFEDQGSRIFHSVDGEGRGLTLTPVAEAGGPTIVDLAAASSAPAVVTLNPVGQAAQPLAAGGSAETPLVAQAAPRPPASAAGVALPARDVAGQYAVMRGDKDTGCMVTLDAPARNGQPAMKARLAPACRDQGIVIFDPQGWQMAGPHLVLKARKGHTLQMERGDDGIWAKEGKEGKPIGLKRL